MNHFFPISVAVIALLTLEATAGPKPQPTPKPKGYDAYSLLRARNIFDPERQPGAAGAPTQAAQTTSADYAALTGIMISGEKTLAFFSGSRPDFNIVLSAGGKIAGATLAKIAPDSIEIDRDGKRITIAIGQTVPLDAKSVPGIAPAAAPTSTSSSSTSASSNASSSAPSSVDREAVIRRMMEKRQQELK